MKNLTIENFEQVITNTPLAAVLFHRHDCEPSRDMIPELGRYAEVNSDLQAFILQKPCTVPLFERFKISAYPTIVIYKNGQRVGAYEGLNDKEPYLHMAAALDELRK